MCAIFGVLDFQGKLTPAQRLTLFRELANAAQIRGTDASDVAFVQNGAIQIQKAPRPAAKMRWRIAPDARFLMGHTRMTTQGSETKNFNNHPFSGKAGGQSFALAHNGVLYNDLALRRTRRLPRTKIQTDSYVAVQLLEQGRELSADSLRLMAEALEGSFTITVLGDANTLYFVRGNNPLTIRLFPYTDAVLAYGQRHGVPEQEMKLLLDAGYDALDLEELIFDDQFRACCVREILADFGVC